MNIQEEYFPLATAFEKGMKLAKENGLETEVLEVFLRLVAGDKETVECALTDALFDWDIASRPEGEKTFTITAQQASDALWQYEKTSGNDNDRLGSFYSALGISIEDFK